MLNKFFLQGTDAQPISKESKNITLNLTTAVQVSLEKKSNSKVDNELIIISLNLKSFVVQYLHFLLLKNSHSLVYCTSNL